MRGASKIAISVRVSLGQDRSRPLGTIFQIRQERAWETVLALGSPQTYNHYARSNPLMFHAHAVDGSNSSFTSSVLGTSTKVRYRLFVLDSVLIDGTNREYFDESLGEWAALPNPWHGVTFGSGQQITYAHRIGSGVFIASDKGVYYDGSLIISCPGPTYASGAGAVLYHDGQIFISWPGDEVKVYNWEPGAAPLTTPDLSLYLGPNNFLRAYGILGETVYLVTRLGGLIRHNKAANTWTTILDGFSGEFYCALGIANELRIGDYPNGDQWLYRPGSPFGRLANYPPRESGASPNARELQAMLLYAGGMVCPTFPWGVVHRQDRATGSWHVGPRLYTAPTITGGEGPYSDALGHGEWRQRIPGGTLWKDGIVFPTSNTPGTLAALGAEQVPNVSEYGKAWFLKRPHAVSGEITWTADPTTLSLELSASDGLVFKRDGLTIAQTPGFAPSAFPSGPLCLEVGDGLYGTFAGTVIETKTELTP